MGTRARLAQAFVLQPLPGYRPTLSSMGDKNVQDALPPARKTVERRAGNSGEGSDSVLRLLRMRRLAQFNETAADPDADREPDPKPEPGSKTP